MSPVDGDLGHAIRVGGDDRTEPAVAGRLGHEPEGGPPKQDRVPPVPGLGRPGRRSTVLVDGRRDEGRDRLDRDQRLVPERDEHRLRVGRDRRESDPQGARQSAFRVGIHHARLPAPRDGVLDRGDVTPEDDDHVVDTGSRERVEDVLEDRPSADRREQLAAAEP